jgi:hypothetical protein
MRKNTNLTQNGTLHSKVWRFDSKEKESGFFVNGTKKAEIVERINFCRYDPRDWLSKSILSIGERCWQSFLLKVSDPNPGRLSDFGGIAFQDRSS